jgi:hypothetical protein
MRNKGLIFSQKVEEIQARMKRDIWVGENKVGYVRI